MSKKDEDKERVLKRFQELYDSDPDLRVVVANEKGDIEKLKNMFIKDKELDILAVTEKEEWNWLHRSLMHIPNAEKWTGTPLSTIEFYIKNKVPVNAQDSYGMTPLHYAMRGKNAEAAIALLEAGADPNIPNRDNVIPLAMIGGMPERLDVLKLMLDKGGNPNYVNANNDMSIVKSLKKHVGNVDKFKPVIELLEKYS
ncbi:ankyrin repeat domain-containing protein [Psychrobacter phenylpyruvicus]|uniref:Ankyrin repeat n=1 Tax=Psychrobacter phenylpyruvicus TaxID=29432 RepID=A0A379LJK1_9GAMM|nr:ankyrin repeat domain-containing protein [Psychrobacter phenylpyruvicus]SUD90601.1 Ankyrin repeat [Psychrobacter phenylpyruvicus]